MMELDQHFLSRVEKAIEDLWEASTITRVSRCSWAHSNLDAVCYCIDHELFGEREPEAARCVKRAIDIYGHLAVALYISHHVKLTEDIATKRPFGLHTC